MQAAQYLQILRKWCVDSLTICGIPLNNIQSLRIYGAASHKPGRKETLCFLKKVSIYSAFNILLGPVRVRHCWRKLWFDSLNNQLANSCGMEKRLFVMCSSNLKFNHMDKRTMIIFLSRAWNVNNYCHLQACLKRTY